MDPQVQRKCTRIPHTFNFRDCTLATGNLRNLHGIHNYYQIRDVVSRKWQISQCQHRSVAM